MSGYPVPISKPGGRGWYAWLTNTFKQDAQLVAAYGTHLLPSGVVSTDDIAQHARSFYNVIWHTRLIKSIVLFLLGFFLLFISLCASDVVPGERRRCYTQFDKCSVEIDGEQICSKLDIETKENAVDGWALTIVGGGIVFFFWCLWTYMTLSRVSRWKLVSMYGTQIAAEIGDIVHSVLLLVAFTMALPRWSGTAEYPWYAPGIISSIALFGYSLQTLMTPLPHSQHPEALKQAAC